MIRGSVREAETGAAISGAMVSIDGAARGALTDSAGRFLIIGVAPGNRVVRARLLGYATAERSVRVRAGDTTDVAFRLVAQARVLASIRTEARAQFEELFAARPNVGTMTVSTSAVEALPRLAEPDIVRVVQLLPGVETRNDYSTAFSVRGGESDQNLILVDGYPVFNPFHLGGLFSTFMDATVRDVNLITGGFPAEYGGRLSSVLDVRSAEDVEPGVHTRADVSLLAATGSASGAFGGGRGTWSFAARRTYADKVVDLFSSEFLPYHFGDLQAHATWVLPRDLHLAVTAYSGSDVLDANLAKVRTDSGPPTADNGGFLFDWGNRVLGATLSKWLNGTDRIEQRLSRSSFSTVLDVGDGTGRLYNSAVEYRLAGSVVAPRSQHELRAGYELDRDRVRVLEEYPATGSRAESIAQGATSLGMYASDLWRGARRWLVEGGVRFESMSGTGFAALSPRLSAKFFASDRTAWTLAVGRYTQGVHSLARDDSPVRIYDTWLLSDSATAVSTAWHYVAGFDRQMANNRALRIEGWYKDYRHLVEPNPQEDPAVSGDEFYPVDGRSYGADLLLRQYASPDARFSGWLSYSYAVSARRHDGVRYFPGQDRRHELNLVGQWRLAKYLVGARFGYSSGTPYTAIIGEFVRRRYDPWNDNWGTGGDAWDAEPLGGPRNGARMPATQRLDVNISRDFRRGHATISPYLSIVNIYNARNAFLYLYDYSVSPPVRRTISQFPIIPSFGARIVF